MSKALPGENYCAMHQGNHSHYAEHNCTVCKLQAQLTLLKQEMRDIHIALDDPRSGVTLTAAQCIAEIRQRVNTHLQPTSIMPNNGGTMEALQFFDILGLRVEDKVTGFSGVVTTLSFDLYGCIQVIVTPPISPGEKQEQGESRWFDVARLRIVHFDPVMAVPDYFTGRQAQGLQGAAEKPPGRHGT